MRAYFTRKLLLGIPTIIGVLTLVFLLLRLVPGDPVRLMLGDAANPADVVALRHQYGLDRPLIVQYLDYVFSMLKGDFGRSLVTGLPVMDQVLRVFPYTLSLGVVSIILTVLIGLPLGVLAAIRSGTLLDYGTMAVSLVGLSLPSFWLAIMLMIVFSVRLEWLPLTGGGTFDQPLVLLQSMILPSICLGVSSVAFAARMTRSSMLEILSQDYIRTARAKGLPERTVMYRHALKNAAIPVVTIVGVLLARLLGGAIVIEVVFSRPGIGQLVVSGILARDYALVQGTVGFFALILVLTNLGVDLLYGYLDPTIRFN